MKRTSLALITLLSPFAGAFGQVLTDYVDPFIGTSGGGNTFPGSVVPWGMVSVSPHNALGSPSGYIFGEQYFYGLGHTHLSGTGCSDYGSILLTVADGRPRSPGSSRSPYKNETASPGFYSVELETPAVRMEASSTLRAGIIRITAMETGVLTILLNAGTSLGITGGGDVQIADDQRMTGYNVGGGMCGELNRHLTYFSAGVDRKPDSSGTWIGETVSSETSASAEDKSVGAWSSYTVTAGESIVVRVGISYVSSANAQLNATAELGSETLPMIRKRAEDAWNEALSRISVRAASRDQLTIFYTALYHSLIHPNIIDDVNGEYPLMGRGGIGVVSGRHRYSVYSLWDTYRTLHPLLTLLFPQIQGDMVQTMVDMYEENGWLPKWELGGNETYLMVGDPASIVIADTYVKGVRNFDSEKAFEAIVKATTLTPDGDAPLIRPGYHDLVLLGYIPADQDTTEDWWVWGPVSTMLEYNLADAAAAIMADSLGKHDVVAELQNRSLYYKNLFDPETGFLRPKNRDGAWMSPFDPLATEGSGSWAGSGGPGYVEGNAWNYTWFVPHDLEGLAGLFGGADAMADKLEESFRNGTFTSTNEPDIGYPYAFAQLGVREHRTHELVRAIMGRDFSTGPSGLPGNDDAGAISAWYVFSALGVYPFFPGSPEYVLGMPAFDEVTLLLPDSAGSPRTLVIERSRGMDAGAAALNGKELGTSVTHGEVMAGGTLIFGTGGL